MLKQLFWKTLRLHVLKITDRKSQKEKSTTKDGNWKRKLRIEKFSNNRVTKNNWIAKIWQLLWARKDNDQFFPWLSRFFSIFPDVANTHIYLNYLKP